MNHLRQATMLLVAAVLASVFGALQAEVPPTIAPIHCDGFDYPMNEQLFMPVNRNRSALPLRATLTDDNGNVVTDADLASAPVVQVLFTSSDPESEPELIDDEFLVSIHDADSGNLFEYMPLSQEWQFNLSARPLEAPGTYEISMESGDTDEYVFPDGEKCKSIFTRVR